MQLTKITDGPDQVVKVVLKQIRHGGPASESCTERSCTRDRFLWVVAPFHISGAVDPLRPGGKTQPDLSGPWVTL